LRTLSLSLYFKYFLFIIYTWRKGIVGERERESIFQASAWWRNAKGKGLRWRILRDLLATCSVEWLSTSEIFDTMTRIRGVTHGKTRELMTALEGMGDLSQERDEKDQVFKWHATRQGVSYWLGKPGDIPAGIVEAVRITKAVSKREG